MSEWIVPMAHGGIIYDSGTAVTHNTNTSDFIVIKNSGGGVATTVTFETGTVVSGTDNDDNVAVSGTSKAIVNAGNFTLDFSGYGQSMIEFNGGTVSRDLWSRTDSTITVTGGTVSNDVVARERGMVTISGGIISDDLLAFDSSTISISSGTIGDDAEAYGSSTLNISGGSIGQDIEALGGTINITGGTLAARGLGTLDSGFGTADNGLITLTGSSFSIGGVAFAGGFITEETGTLSGMLQDGSSFANIPFNRKFGSATAGNIRINVVPEPSSFLLSMLVTLGAVARRRRQSASSRS